MDTDEKPPRPVYSRAQAMEKLDVSESTFHRWAAEHPDWKADDIARPGAWYYRDMIDKHAPPPSGS